MKDFIPIITAVIAFAGTILGIYIGYRKWRRDQDSARFGQFEKDKQLAYKNLWERVEEINIKVRVEEVNSDQFLEHLQELNRYMLKHGIYFDDDDRALANKYAEAVYSFQNTVRDSGAIEASVPLGATQDIPQSVLQGAKEIGEAQSRALKLRSEIREKIRSVLSGST